MKLLATVAAVVFALHLGVEQVVEQRIAYWAVFERFVWVVELERVLGIDQLDIALLRSQVMRLPDDSLNVGMLHRPVDERMVGVDWSAVDTEMLAVPKCTFAFDYVDRRYCDDGRCLDRQIHTVRKLVQLLL